MIFLIISILLILIGVSVILISVTSNLSENKKSVVVANQQELNRKEYSFIDTKSEKDIVKDFRELLLAMFSKSDSYHNHKEKMAHVGVALQLTLTAWMISQKVSSNSNWIENIGMSQPNILLLYIVIWFILHVFIRWQLLNRRAAAIELATFQKTLRKWSYKTPSKKDLEPFYVESNGKLNIEQILDYIIPIKTAPSQLDITKDCFPTDMAEIWKAQENKGSGALYSEWILWFASILMFAIGIFCIIF